MNRPLVLVSDFGRRDPYVGVVEAVMASIAPAARCIHVTHDVPPQDVRAGSFILAYALPWIPSGSVVWAVVDPGVGTDRRAIAVEGRMLRDAREQRVTLVAPDNGLLTEVLGQMDVAAVVSLDTPRFHGEGRSATFHGRDLFGPAAAWLARGEPIASLGTAVDPTALARLEVPGPQRIEGGWRGTVRWVDRFGDLVTDLPASLLAQGTWVARVGLDGAERRARDLGVPDEPATLDAAGTARGASTDVPVGTTFGSVGSGETVAYAGSWETVEIAVRDGSAAERFGAGLGTQIALRSTSS